MTIERNILNQRALPLDHGPMDDGAAATGSALSRLIRITLLRWRLIVGTGAAVFILTALVVFRMTPLFDATATVMLDQRENKVTDVNAVLSGLSSDDTTIENQLQILHSRSLMGRVVDKLQLDAPSSSGSAASAISTFAHAINPSHWFSWGAGVPMTSAEKAEARRDAAIDGLLGGETITQIGFSSAMQITYRSPDPAKSSQIANAIADAYVEDQLNAKFEATEKTSRWLADRLQQLSVQMQKADVAVQQYKVAHNITDTATGTLVDQQLAQINGQLITARSQLAEAQATYQRVKELQANGHAEDLGQVFQSGMISTLRQQQADLLRQKAQLSTVFGPNHPKMLDIESQIRDIDGKVTDEVKRVVETVANNVAVAQAQVSSLEGSLHQLEGQSDQQNQAGVQLSQLKAAATSTHQLYEAFLSKFKETQGQEGIQTPDARVISRATTPSSPAVPATMRLLELGALCGLLIGFAIAFTIERLDTGFRTATQIESLLDVPVLGTLPELLGASKTNEQAADQVIEKPLSSFSEAIRGLQMGLDLSNVDHKPKLVLITSSVPDEGKTTVAIALGRSLARSGQKILLIDGDQRRPSLADALGLPANQKGLAHILSEDATLEECIVKDPKSNMSVLPTISVKANAPDVLASVRLQELLDSLRSRYDRIILDSAPLLPVHDTKILAPKADAVLFVVRWENTPREAVANAARALADINAKVAGVVMTRADTERHRYYSYGYNRYSNYNKYYSS